MKSSSVFFMPAGVPFLEGLAAGLQKESAQNPLSLAQVRIYLPHKRAVKALKDIFLKEKKSLFLPQIISLGELESHEELFDSSLVSGGRRPVISPTLRRGLLTTLIRQKQEILAAQARRLPPPLAVTLQLAQELIRLLDQATIEQVPLNNLAALVPEHLATHWQVSLDFLHIISHHWPLLLAEKGVQDPYTAHNQTIQDLLNQWAQNPPAQRIVVAGSTGTMPATAAFLKAVAQLPQGMALLPGLDPTLPLEEQKALSPSHPQYALYRLLTRLNLTPQEVPVWPLLATLPGHGHAETIAQGRRRWFSQAYAGSPSPSSPAVEAAALEGLTFLPCASPQEEALVIALMLRETLEIPHKTAALITPDRRLARRVTGELGRWGIIPHDTGGIPLTVTPPGTFLRLMVRAVWEDFAPVPLLALLKHPLILGGKAPRFLQKGVALLEQHVLRGPRPDAGIAGICAALPTSLAQHRLFSQGLTFLEKALAPLYQALAAPQIHLGDLLHAHIQSAEALCGKELWEKEMGFEMAQFFHQLQESAGAFPRLKGADYADMLDLLLGSATVYPGTPTHPRLSIFGTLEARLLHADVIILGSLNEGVWPPDLQGDPWLSRPMREDLGLPDLERRIGLASHDFGQAFAHQRVVLTRALRVDGTPTVPSRIFLRLETTLKAAGLTMPQDPKWLTWAQALDLPPTISPCPPPAPCPPVSARPRRLSVTQVETWKRDPYALYARHILNLKPLDPLDADPTQGDQGTLIHQILDEFLRRCSDIFTEQASFLLLDIGEKAFHPFINRPVVRAFWWPRFTQIVQWFLEAERERRLSLPPYKTLTEVQGKLIFHGPHGPFELVARADRLDLFEDGRVDLIDYKTGAPPTERDVTLGFSPQLPLEAVLIDRGGFPTLLHKTVGDMSFWRLCGGQRGGEMKPLKTSSAHLLPEAWEGMQRLITAFDDPQTPYLAQPLSDKGLPYNAYAHLARLRRC